ncbi:MAG: hypothetical protein IT431_09370 [Phycisphaerales bacterium]|jgi:hypothetical protein|nr:hypothetical protein [Phycisphaerales bacterium]
MGPILAMDDSLIVPVLAIGLSFLVALVAIIFGVVKSIMETKAREETKRELAAYIAEGSMTPEDAERIVKADIPHWKQKSCG